MAIQRATLDAGIDYEGQRRQRPLGGAGECLERKLYERSGALDGNSGQIDLGSHAASFIVDADADETPAILGVAAERAQPGFACAVEQLGRLHQRGKHDGQALGFADEFALGDVISLIYRDIRIYRLANHHGQTTNGNGVLRMVNVSHVLCL